MSRTYRTDREHQIAERRILRDREGNPLLPRIVRRKPRPGDIHPILTRQLKMVFGRLPLEYLYNLSSVEMLPRKDGIGEPFGEYLPDEKRIILYSLPLNWKIDYGDRAAAERSARHLDLENLGAGFDFVGNSLKVTWPDARRMGYWFCCIVLLHEFGHHFRSSYPSKRTPGIRIRVVDEEYFAERKSFDLYREIFINYRGTKNRHGQ